MMAHEYRTTDPTKLEIYERVLSNGLFLEYHHATQNTAPSVNRFLDFGFFMIRLREEYFSC